MSLTRLFFLGGFLALANPLHSHAQDAKPLAKYADAEAAQHAGQEATVVGKVAAVTKSAKGTVYLNFGEKFPKHVFSGVVFAGDAAQVGDLKPFEGKTVALIGKIELSPQDQKPQIVIKKIEQITLAEPGAQMPPAAPVASATPVATKPSAPAPAAATPLPPLAAPARKIALAAKWTSPTQRGEMTRKDLALLFGTLGSASESVEVPAGTMVYPGIPMLTPLAEAKKTLKLENIASTAGKVTCAGLPVDSLTAHTFSGIFAGGFNKLSFVTDLADQVVSVLLVDENSRARVTDLTDTAGYHTYNFVASRVKGTNELIVRHEIAKTGAPPGVVLVDSLLIDANDIDDLEKARTATTRSRRPPKPTTGRVMERSQWFVPQPLVNLILRGVGSR